MDKGEMNKDEMNKSEMIKDDMKDITEKFDGVRLVGEGAFGSVYAVHIKGEKRTAALKIINDLSIWRNEKRFLALADHPAFPKLERAWEEDGKGCLLMSYIYGERLDVTLDRRGRFNQADAMRIALGIADGIAYLQQRDGHPVFRDIKASNIILQPDGEPVIVDFGSVCFLEDAGKSLSGTKGYAAPETANMTAGGAVAKSADDTNRTSNAPKVGLYTDVYSFGKLFMYLLTGEAPAEGYPGRLREYDPALSPSLELLIDDCVSDEAGYRPPDMYSVLDRMMTIGTATPRKLKKMEKQAAAAMAKRNMDPSGGEADETRVKYIKNISE